MEHKAAGNIIYTNKARCRDCYKCLRNCPVKAIKLFKGQAYVDAEKCVVCGQCVKVCPQGAKVYRKDVEKVKELLQSDKVKVASVAPAYAAVYEKWEKNRLAAALKLLGFNFVEETAIGAHHASLEAAERLEEGKSQICSFCPSVVNYIEKYRPEIATNLIAVASPMITHARMLRQKYGKDAVIVFIGPCLAKKQEAERPGFEGIIDAVLTFREMEAWFRAESLSLSECEESSFDYYTTGESLLFALESGFLKTARIDDSTGFEPEVVTGFNGVSEICSFVENNDTPKVIEALMCEFGCINGPGIKSTKNIFNRKKNIHEHFNEDSERFAKISNDDHLKNISYAAKFAPAPLKQKTYTEEEIAAVLKKTGKTEEEDILNCGACGYNTCREKAIAVLSGMAEIDMCLPYMRTLAEKRTDRIIETSPNGIVILDEEFTILHANPAFKKFFKCSDAAVGNSIASIINIEPFEELAAGEDEVMNSTIDYPQYGISCHQLIYRLQKERQYVGIFVDMTTSIADRNKLEKIKSQTVMQAQELLEHQIEMAQKLAQFLGENTAKGEVLVENLMKLSFEDANKNRPDKNWLWNTSTSK